MGIYVVKILLGFVYYNVDIDVYIVWFDLYCLLIFISKVLYVIFCKMFCYILVVIIVLNLNLWVILLLLNEYLDYIFC